MGLLVDGVWHDEWYDTTKTGGRFVRSESRFRDRVTADGSSGFPAAAGRYHLFVSLACPWAHRTLVYRALKGLEEAITVSVVDPLMLEHGWAFGPPGSDARDPLTGARYLYEVYLAACPGLSGRVTVPVLWDKERRTIVNNESGEIIRMLNREFDAVATRSVPDLYPAELAAEIDALNARIYDTVNNGVYKAGFATAQDAYEEAAEALFGTLDWLEQRLETRRYLLGDRPTEADWRLFTTLVRFDAVYYSHFKCNRRQLRDYPALWGYVRDLYQTRGVAGTVNLDHIKRHYYVSQRTINPSQVVPIGPGIDFGTPHGRERLAGD
ncbi:glutathione S-transferase family protein [Rhodocista pekingensis]|uniref:Glutathione S-transferase family protein n=1 Tax=Rhodocista pekingensis TaxID=201185 RepID=A0ABW2KS04_9PROT